MRTKPKLAGPGRERYGLLTTLDFVVGLPGTIAPSDSILKALGSCNWLSARAGTCVSFTVNIRAAESGTFLAGQRILVRCDHAVLGLSPCGLCTRYTRSTEKD